MAVKGFTEGEWKVLQYAVTDLVEGIGMAEPGFFGGRKGNKAMVRHLKEVRDGETEPFLQEVLHDVNFLERDPELHGRSGSDEYVASIAARARHAVELVTENAPEHAAAFRDMLLETARVGAAASKGVNDAEQTLLDALSEAAR